MFYTTWSGIRIKHGRYSQRTGKERGVALDNDVHVVLNQLAREINRNSGFNERPPEGVRKG